MTQVNKRETRALPVALEARAAGDGGERTLAGYIEYQKESHVMRDWLGDQFIEELAAGCFDKSLASREVVGLWSHDTAQVLGNTKSGTLRISSEATQLGFELDLPNTQAGNDAWESVKRGDVDGVSFGMRVTKDKWSTEKREDETLYKRTILEADLYEISPVAFAAYPANGVACRSLEEYKEAAKMSELTTKPNLDATPEQETKEQANEGAEPMENRTMPSVAIATNDNREQRAAFNHYLRTGELRALAVSDDTKGAALAPVDFAKEIIDGLADVGVMRQLARILPAVSGKSATYPRRTSGAGAAMVEEGAPITPADMTFDQVVLTPKKAAALVEVSNELLADAGLDLAGYLAQHFTDEIGELIEGQYWNGDATGANLLGILAADDGEVVPKLLIERVETAGATITADDVLALWAALPAKYRKTASFVCSSALEAQLRTLKDGDGRYLLVNDLATGLGSTLLGRPLHLTEAFPGELTAGTDALMVGDFKRAVYIADKSGIDIQRNDSIGFNRDTTAFRAIFRTDIALALPEALRVLAIKA